ncbi:hypothetical protein PHYSODRAFT_339710 [Phytophthora sojae]|uniref:Uncharacterized protein n=1 Tax=Phytophthora sojae (strain P6497) TaxID=1094619 RepID=G5A7D8_PHYSP|nr:hypothetical protein PHYSODRAFT_339710 [Phytophthora sojae]EGZ07817.1 hypothetical protein PHYSODRAFT_339710 [Phytophthora sojae]|eukprot:XP_009535989.1 hypothetical protein PHYSODRAFT_339710 [Phytophthora sojae]
MMADHAAPDIAPARPRVVEEAAVIQDSPQPAAEDGTPLPVPPSFAFPAWKAELELMLQRGTELVHESVQALQGDFDDRSQFVRGDFAWRKQVTAFHDRLQDVLTDQLGLLAESISKHAAQVAESLAQTLAKAERDGQRAIHQQEQKGELALRRARAALTKEVERISRLEKCLRLEEARQAAAILVERERQLTTEHNARESHLQALLGDMRSSNESLETLNSQLLEALRTSRTELDQLRNTLVRSISRSKRRGSVNSQGDDKNAGVESATRGSGEKSGKNSTASLPSTANELLLVPSLRQSLSAATQTVANLKSRVSELESARDSDKKRLQELQLALAHAENEKLKATQLLGEARSALIDNESKLVEAANESVRWQDKFDRLQALAQGRERALADSQRLENATRDQLAVLTSRVERVATIEARWRDFERAVKETQQRQPGDEGEVSALKSEMDKLQSLTETQKELEIRLRYEFERRFGEQLILRISHERRRVLERLERICAAEAKDKQEKGQRRRQSFSRVHQGLESDFTRLKRLVKAAYDQLGICVGAWAETDLDGLHARLSAFEAQVQALERDLEAAANRAEAQRVSLVRAELAQQEKDLLLAELTSRYQQLRAAQVAWEPYQQQLEQQGALQRQSIERKPLTVYGLRQRHLA